MSSREIMQMALEALEYANTGNRRPEIIGPAITALRKALEQQAETVQENPDLTEWKEQGETIMAQAGIGFWLGAWWADRPWRQR